MIPEHDVEITPAMIEAGVARLQELGQTTSSAYAVAEICSAMLAAAPARGASGRATTDVYNRYLFEYRHAGSEWGIEVAATSPQDAQERLKALGWAKYKGEVVATIPVPGAGVIRRILARVAMWQ